MSEILGAIFMLALFFLIGAFCNHLDWRKEQKKLEQQAREDERIELEAMYVVCAIEYDRRKQMWKLAEARKYCTKSFRY